MRAGSPPCLVAKEAVGAQGRVGGFQPQCSPESPLQIPLSFPPPLSCQAQLPTLLHMLPVAVHIDFGIRTSKAQEIEAME